MKRFAITSIIIASLAISNHSFAQLRLGAASSTRLSSAASVNTPGISNALHASAATSASAAKATESTAKATESTAKATTSATANAAHQTTTSTVNSANRAAAGGSAQTSVQTGAGVQSGSGVQTGASVKADADVKVKAQTH